MILVIGVLGMLIVFFADRPSRQEINAMMIGDVDFSNLKDGVYIGEYKGTKGHLRDATVEVSISSGQIVTIRILKGAIDKDGNPIIINKSMSIIDLYQNVIQEQSLQVDVVSGATLTSKAHLKALENALKKAIED